MATLRRVNSEGCLLDLDLFPWGKVDLKTTEHDDQRDYGTSSVAEVEEDAERLPATQEPGACTVSKKQLTKELSVSVENLRHLQEKKSKCHHLDVAAIGEGCRAYSDGQLAPAEKGGTGSVESEDLPSPSTAHPFALKSQHRAKLSAAKLHLKSLFGQVGPQFSIKTPPILGGREDEPPPRHSTNQMSQNGSFPRVSPKASQTTADRILWSDETRFKLLL